MDEWGRGFLLEWKGGSTEQYHGWPRVLNLYMRSNASVQSRNSVARKYCIQVQNCACLLNGTYGVGSRSMSYALSWWTTSLMPCQKCSIQLYTVLVQEFSLACCGWKFNQKSSLVCPDKFIHWIVFWLEANSLRNLQVGLPDWGEVPKSSSRSVLITYLLSALVSVSFHVA